MEERKGRRVETFGFAVVIRCLLHPSNELRRAMETLNRYIDGGRKRDQPTDLRGIKNSDAEYGLVAHGNLAAPAATLQATRLPLQFLRLTQPRLQRTAHAS